MSKKDVRIQFADFIRTSKFTEALALLEKDEAWLIRGDNDGNYSFLSDLCQRYEIIENTSRHIVLSIIALLNENERSSNTTAMHIALSKKFMEQYGSELALDLIKSGFDITISRGYQKYPPLAYICNIMETNQGLCEVYKPVVISMLNDGYTELRLNDAFAQKMREKDPSRYLPLWKRLINLGFKDDLKLILNNQIKQFNATLSRKDFVKANIQLDSIHALAEMYECHGLTCAEHLLGNIRSENVKEVSQFLVLVAIHSRDIKDKPGSSNKPLKLICQEDEIDVELITPVVKKLVLNGFSLDRKWGTEGKTTIRDRLIELKIPEKQVNEWVAEYSLKKSERERTRSRSPSRRRTISPRRGTNALNNENTTQFIESLKKLDFTTAKVCIENNASLVHQNVRFDSSTQSVSAAYYLTSHFPECTKEDQERVRDFLKFLNDQKPIGQSFITIQRTIHQLSEHDESFKDKCQLLVDLYEEECLDTVDELIVESSAQVEDEEKTIEKIVEDSIRECINIINANPNGADALVSSLVRDTMNYSQTFMLDNLAPTLQTLTHELATEDHLENFRKVVGGILNKTADQYIEENEKVTNTFHKTLWLCLTIIGALVPLIYYFAVVKPTKESSPLVAYEMSKNVFDQLMESATTPNNTVLCDDGTINRSVFFSTDFAEDAKQHNGQLEEAKFYHQADGWKPQVRWVGLKGSQADQFAERMSNLEDELASQAIKVL